MIWGYREWKFTKDRWIHTQFFKRNWLRNKKWILTQAGKRKLKKKKNHQKNQPCHILGLSLMSSVYTQNLVQSTSTDIHYVRNGTTLLCRRNRAIVSSDRTWVSSKTTQTFIREYTNMLWLFASYINLNLKSKFPRCEKNICYINICIHHYHVLSLF